MNYSVFIYPCCATTANYTTRGSPENCFQSPQPTLYIGIEKFLASTVFFKFGTPTLFVVKTKVYRDTFKSRCAQFCLKFCCRCSQSLYKVVSSKTPPPPPLGCGKPTERRGSLGMPMSMSAAAKGGKGEGRFDATELLELGYRDLQKLAKENNVSGVGGLGLGNAVGWGGGGACCRDLPRKAFSSRGIGWEGWNRRRNGVV